MNTLLEKYNLELENPIYVRAFTHSSYVNEVKKGEDYERLEFLGDKILDFIVSEYLYVNNHYTEGEMTKLRACYVCENALYHYSLDLKLNEMLRLGKGEEATGGRNRKAVVADIFEAFLAATYLVHGMDKAKQIVYDNVIPYIEKKVELFLTDYKSMLQELVQAEKESIEYVLIDETGPAHQKTFTFEARVDGITLGIGTANSKKEAEQQAAKDALSKQAKI